MDLAEYLAVLERIGREFEPNERDGGRPPVWTRFYEAFVDHVANKKVPTDGALTALASTLSLFCKLRRQVPADLNWDQLGHVVFIEAARVVLGLDFQKLDDSDPLSPKAVFKKALNQACVDLQDSPSGQFFLVLQWLVTNGWTHPVLQDMMKGLEIEEEKVQTYLRSGEYPEILRLRVDMLMENGCDDFALNLATWCTKSQIFQSDPYIRQAQLLLLIKLNRQEEFHNVCWQIWQLQCCLSLCILKVILSKGREEDKRPLLTLTQTFLVHDWMKPEKYCCTEPLLKFWLSLEREQEPNPDVFIQSVSKMEQLASEARQLQILVKALSLQFPGEFLQFSLECMLRAIRLDRNKLDTARIYVKDDKEADQAADNLARSCLVIALMFKDDIRIQLSANMTAFYLDPTEEMYHKIKKAVLANQLTVKNSTNQQSSGTNISDEEVTVPQDPIIPPSEVDGHTFFELMHAVDTLRPNTFSIYLSWNNLQKHLRASLEEAGYIYNHRKDSFMTLEEKIIRKRRAVEKAQKKKLKDDLLKPGANAEGESSSDHPVCEVDRLGLNTTDKKLTDSQDLIVAEPQPELSCNQSMLPPLCPGVIDDPKETVSIPLLDITLDELQQVLDNSSHSKAASTKEPYTTEGGGSSSLSDATEKKESTEDIMVNSIKEFLKGGDVEMQGLAPHPSQHISVCDGAQTQTQTQQGPPHQQSMPQLTQPCTDQPASAYASKQHVSQMQQPLTAELKSHHITQTLLAKPSNKASESAIKNESVTISNDLTEPTVFNCKYCGKPYSSMRQRRRHQEWLCKSKVNAAAGEKTLVELVKEKDRVRSTSDNSSLLRDDYGNYLCELCRRPCGTVSALKLHQRRAHGGYKGKTNLPSGISIKECSVKLDRLEDAPVPKVFKKFKQLTEKGKGKEGISKLLSKKYSTGFFLSSLNSSKDSKSEKEAESSQKIAGKGMNMSQKTTSEEDHSAKENASNNDSLTNNSVPFDLNAGDAQVELFAPSDDSHPVLCDLCGAVCSSYKAMKEHQAVCAHSAKAVSAEQDDNEHSASASTSVSSSNPPVSASVVTSQSPAASKSSSFLSSNKNLPVTSQQPIPSALQTLPEVKQNSLQSNKSNLRVSLAQLPVSEKDKIKQNHLRNKPNRNLSPPPKPRKKLITLSYRTCLTCNLEFSTASTCFQHQSNMSHFQGGVALVTKYKCAECGTIFSSSREVESHFLMHDDPPVKKKPVKSSKKAPLKPKEKMKSPPAKPAGQEIFKSLLVYCQYCKKGFLSQTSLDNHQHQGCEARPLVNNMMIVQSGSAETFDVSLSPMTGLIHYNTPQIVQAVDTYGLSGVAQIAPGVANEIVVMTEQMMPDVVIDPLASSYITTLPDAATNAGIVELSAVASQIDSMVTSPGDLNQPTVMRQEMGTQVDIDSVPLAELENDMKELASDLMCNDDPMLDSSDLMMDGDQKCSQDGNVQVETITYKNVSMLQHKMWLCSVCNMEFALKKDVFWHWEQSTCKNQGAKVTDAVNYQCIYCGEMFSEPTECRDHQLASCLKAAGMQVQLLKNRHFHCRMCKGRYYERDHVEKHLSVYHRLSKKEVETKIKEWFPDSYVRSIEEMLRSKKQSKQRYHHSDSQDANKKSTDAAQQIADDLAKQPKLEQISEPIQSPVKQYGSAFPLKGTSPGDACLEGSMSAQLQDQVTVVKPDNVSSVEVSHPVVVSVLNTGQKNTLAMPSVTIQPVRVSVQPTAPPAVTAVAAVFQPAALGSGQDCVGNQCFITTGTGSNVGSDTKQMDQSLNVHGSDNQTTSMSKAAIVPLPSLCSTPTVQLPTVPEVQNTEAENCGSPVPTCNISWSSNSDGSSVGPQCPQNTSQLRLPAPSVPDKIKNKSKKNRRSSSTESQLSNLSAKEKKSRGRSPVAPPEYHPCPKCGKVIEDRIALQIHLEFICGKSPTQVSPARTPPRTPQKNTKKRRRQNSQGSSYSHSQDTSDSRSIVSDDGSMSSASRANTPSHAGVDSEASQVKYQSEIARWKCNFCAESFTESSDLEKHVFTVHAQIVNISACPQCGHLYDGNTICCKTCLQKPTMSVSAVVNQRSYLPSNCHPRPSVTSIVVNSSQSSQDKSQTLNASESQPMQDNLQLLSVTAINAQSALSVQPLDLPDSPTSKTNPPAFSQKVTVGDDTGKAVASMLQQDTTFLLNISTKDDAFVKQQEQALDSSVTLTNQMTGTELKNSFNPGDVQGKSPCHKDSDTDSGCDEGLELDKALQDGPDNLVLPLMLSPNHSGVVYGEDGSVRSYLVTEDDSNCVNNTLSGSQCEAVSDSEPTTGATTPAAVGEGFAKDTGASNTQIVPENTKGTFDAPVTSACQFVDDSIVSSHSECTGNTAISSGESSHHPAGGGNLANVANDAERQTVVVKQSENDGINDVRSDAGQPNRYLLLTSSQTGAKVMGSNCNSSVSNELIVANVLNKVAQNVMTASEEVGINVTKSEQTSVDIKEAEHSEAASCHDNNCFSSSLPLDESQCMKVSWLTEAETQQSASVDICQNEELSCHCSDNLTDICSGIECEKAGNVNISQTIKEGQSFPCSDSSPVGEGDSDVVSLVQDGCLNSPDTNVEKIAQDQWPVRITRSMRQRMEQEAWMKERGDAIQEDKDEKSSSSGSYLEEGRDVSEEEMECQGYAGDGKESDAHSNDAITENQHEDKSCSGGMQSSNENVMKGKRKKANNGFVAAEVSSDGEHGSCEEQKESALSIVQSKKARHSVTMIRQSVRSLSRRHSCSSLLSNTSESSCSSAPDVRTAEGQSLCDSSTSDLMNIKCGKQVNQEANCSSQSPAKEDCKPELNQHNIMMAANRSEEKRIDGTVMVCDKTKTNRPKPISCIEKTDFDFHSAVARAIKAWSKPVQKKSNSEKNGSEKMKSLDVLLSRKKVVPCHMERLPKSVQKSKAKLDGCKVNSASDNKPDDSMKELGVDQTALVVAANTDKNQSGSLKSSDNHWQQSFSVKWKTFGKQPQEVNINIPLNVTETPTTKPVDMVSTASSEVQSSVECANSQKIMADGSTSQNAKPEVEATVDLQEAVTESQERGAVVSVPTDQNKDQSSSLHGASVMDVCAGSPTRADFMEYHKELHDMVMGEGVDVFLSDEAELLLDDSNEKSFLDLSLCNETLENSAYQAGDEVGCLQGGHYICPFCDDERSFRFEYNLTSHLKCVHGVVKEEPHEAADLYCPICKDLPAFDELLMLLYHMRAVHGIANFDVGSKSTKSSAASVTGQSFRSTTAQEPAESSQQNQKWSTGRESKFGSPKNDMEGISDVESTCSDVSITGITSIELGISLEEDFINRHPELAAKVVSAQRVCSSCNVAFLRMEHYKSHVLRYHTAEQKALQWRCGLCSKLFLQHDEWRKHLYEHFPSRKSAKQKSARLTVAEKQVLREAACRECKRPSPTQAKPGTVGNATSHKSAGECNSKPSIVNKWDELFGLDSDVERLDKVARTYSRSSLNASKKTVQSLQCPSSSDAKVGVLKKDKDEGSVRLMEPLSVRIPNDDDDRLKAQVQNSLSDTCSNSQTSTVSKSGPSVSPSGTTSPVSKTEMSPLSVSSNPEMTTGCIHAVAKRRHSCDGSDTQQTLETKTYSLNVAFAKDMEKRVIAASLKRELRSNNVASKDKENSSQPKGSTNKTSLKSSCASRRSTSKLRNTSRNTRQTSDTKTGVQYMSRTPDLCWKLPWEHYLRNTLRKQVSSGKKSSQASEDERFGGSQTLHERDTVSGQSVSKKKTPMTKKLTSKGGSANSVRPSSKQHSSEASTSAGPLPRRRRFSLSSDSLKSSLLSKRRRADSFSLGLVATSADQQPMDAVVSPRRLSMRLNHGSEVKGMAQHTRSAEQPVSSRSTRRTPAKNKK